MIGWMNESIYQFVWQLKSWVQTSVFLWLEMWQSLNSNSSTFELWMFSTDSKFNECFKRLVVECKFVEKSLFHKNDFIQYAHTAREHRQTFFPKFNLSHKLPLLNMQHNFCSLMCYTVLIRTLILLTSGNDIVTLLLNWSKPVNVYVPTDKINASIRIQQILKVKIRIQRMRILTSFVTSLLQTTYHLISQK